MLDIFCTAGILYSMEKILMVSVLNFKNMILIVFLVKKLQCSIYHLYILPILNQVIDRFLDSE